MTYSDGKLPAPVSSRAEERVGMGQRLWAIMKRRAERSPATMELATLRSEISPLRFASVEMTGVRGIVLGNLLPGITVCCLPLSSSRAGLPVVMSDRYSSLLKRRVEKSPATMGRATFRSEISLLRFAVVEMTGRYHLFLYGPFVFRTDAEIVPPFIGLYQQRGEKAGPKSFLCRSAQSMEAERGGQKPS